MKFKAKAHKAAAATPNAKPFRFFGNSKMCAGKARIPAMAPNRDIANTSFTPGAATSRDNSHWK